MTDMTDNTRLPNQEGFQQLLDILKSFKGEYNEKNIATVDICKRMKEKYGHIYKLPEMEYYLVKLTKHTGLKKSGETIKETDKEYINTTNKNSQNKEIFMPIKPDSDGIYKTSVWDV